MAKCSFVGPDFGRFKVADAPTVSFVARHLVEPAGILLKLGWNTVL
jgi:hypothetical protein